METTMDFDKFGHCVVCHQNMLIEQVVDGKVIKRFTADYDETQFLLNTGSRMRVAICKKCKEGLTEDDNERIMKCVLRGWDVETDELVKDKKKPNWTKEKKDAYMYRQAQLEIVTNSDGMPVDIMEKKLKKYKEDKIEKAKKDKVK
jgi:hypothetical protein